MRDAANEKDRPFPGWKLQDEELGGKERCVRNSINCRNGQEQGGNNDRAEIQSAVVMDKHG